MGGVLAPPVQLDHDVAAARHHVVVGHDVAVGGDDEAGAEARARRGRPVTLEEPPEELGPGIARPRLPRAHVHHGGAGGLGQLDPDREGSQQGPVAPRIRPEARHGPGEARRVEIDPDRDDPAHHQEDGDHDERDEPDEPLGHAAILPVAGSGDAGFPGRRRALRCRLAARGRRMAEWAHPAP